MWTITEVWSYKLTKFIRPITILTFISITVSVNYYLAILSRDQINYYNQQLHSQLIRNWEKIPSVKYKIHGFTNKYPILRIVYLRQYEMPTLLLYKRYNYYSSTVILTYMLHVKYRYRIRFNRTMIVKIFYSIVFN